jgi:hypothetical protein
MMDVPELQFLKECAELYAGHLRGEHVTSEMVREIGRKIRKVQVQHALAQTETAQIFDALENGDR